MEDEQFITGAKAGLSGEDQIRIALHAINANGGTARMPELYSAVEKHMNGKKLSTQGEASLRNFINRVAVKAGYVFQESPRTWRITANGKEFLNADATAVEEVFNLVTERTETAPSNSVRGTAFENYILDLLKNIYPHYTWYHQGVHKSKERGLDFIGSQIGKVTDHPQFIGVQVKFHAADTVPTSIEWFKFLAGCFARQIDQAVFITTGRLTSEQRREAGEARVVVIEGREEIKRIANIYRMEEFELFEKADS